MTHRSSLVVVCGLALLACRSSDAPDAGPGPVTAAVSDALATNIPDVPTPAEDVERAAPTATTPIRLTPHPIETRGLRLRHGSEDAASGAGARPTFSADGRVLGLAAAFRLSFVDGHDGRWLGSFDVTPPLLTGDPPVVAIALTVSPSGASFALHRGDGAGVIADRATGATSGVVPPARSAAWLDDESLLVLAARGLVMLDREGRTKASSEDGELAAASSLIVLGDAFYVRFAGYVRAFDPRTLAWSGSARALTEADLRVCAVRGHQALLMPAPYEGVDATVLDLRTGKRRTVHADAEDQDAALFSCGQSEAFPTRDGRAIVSGTFCPPVDCFIVAHELATTSTLLAAALPEPLQIGLSDDDSTLALTDRWALTLAPAKPREAAPGRSSEVSRRDRWEGRPRLSPDGKALVGARSDALVIVDIESGTERLARLPPDVRLEEFAWYGDDSARLLAIVWTPDPDLDGEVRLGFAWLDIAQARFGPVTTVGKGDDEWLGEIKTEMPGAKILRTADGRSVIAYRNQVVEVAPGEVAFAIKERAAITRAAPPAEPGIVADPGGRWVILVASDQMSGERLTVVALAPELQGKGAVRRFDPHLGPVRDVLVRPDGSLVTTTHDVLAVWDIAAWLAGP